MPTPSNGTALLSLGGAITGAPWNWEKWHDITAINIPPWCDVDVTSAVGWGPDKASKVKEYARAFWGKSEADQVAFAKAQRRKVKNRKKKHAKKAKGKGKAKMVAGDTDAVSEIGSGSSKSNVSSKRKGSSSASLAGTSTSGTSTSTVDYVTSEEDSDDAGQAVQDTVDEGRTIWNKWTTEQFTKWGINKLLDRVLAEAQKDPATVMRKLKTAEVRCL
jgi:hypothetical protein